MKEVISRLEKVGGTLREFQDALRAYPWPSKAISHMANDVIIYGGMTASATERLVGLLKDLPEAKVEDIEPTEEETGGEGSGEPVQESEEHPDGSEAPPQEREAKGSKGSKRSRKREG